MWWRWSRRRINRASIEKPWRPAGGTGRLGRGSRRAAGTSLAHLEGLGLDLARLQNDMNAPDIASLIARDMADVNTLNINKTPEFFVNGKPLPSFGYEPLKKLVDEALASEYR
ncbi:MAG: thioredoxin domain-containing protein [Thiobacillus sp.]